MANVDFPSGLRVIQNQNGSAPRVQAMDCVTAPIYKGLPAFVSSTGLVQVLTSNTVITSTLAKKIVGVFAQSKPQGAAGAEGDTAKVLVYTDPEQLYVIQSDDATLASVTNFVGRYFALTNGAAGNTTTLMGLAEIDGNTGASTVFATGSGNCQFIQVQKSLPKVNGNLSTWGKFVVRIAPAAHIYANTTGA